MQSSIAIFALLLVHVAMAATLPNLGPAEERLACEASRSTWLAATFCAEGGPAIAETEETPDVSTPADLQLGAVQAADAQRAPDLEEPQVEISRRSPAKRVGSSGLVKNAG